MAITTLKKVNNWNHISIKRKEKKESEKVNEVAEVEVRVGVDLLKVIVDHIHLLLKVVDHPTVTDREIGTEIHILLVDPIQETVILLVVLILEGAQETAEGLDLLNEKDEETTETAVLNIDEEIGTEIMRDEKNGLFILLASS